MADVDKLLSKLDVVEDKIRDWEKSSDAEKAVVSESVERVEKELSSQRKQLQDIATESKRHSFYNATDKDLNRLVGEEVVKAQSEGTDASGGYAVADEFGQTIRSTQNKYGVVRQIWGDTIIPMATDVLKVPTRVYGDTAGNQPEMAAVSEGNALSADDGKIGQITLTAAKYGTLVYVSSELMADAFVDYVGAYLRSQIAHEAAKKEDDLVFEDDTDGLLQDSNILETQMASGKTTFADTTVENLRALQDQVTDEAWENGAYYCHRSVRTQLANVRVGGSTTTDGPFAWGNPNAGIPPTLDGYEVIHVGKMPANSATAVDTEFLLFGDLPNAMLVGERGTAELAISDQYRFANDQTSVRYLFRFAFQTDANLGRAAARLKTAAS